MHVASKEARYQTRRHHCNESVLVEFPWALLQIAQPPLSAALVASLTQQHSLLLLMSLLTPLQLQLQAQLPCQLLWPLQ